MTVGILLTVSKLVTGYCLSVLTFFGYLYNTDSLDKVTDSNNWYATFTLNLNTPAPPAPTPPLSGLSATCNAIGGALIFSGSTFLGRVTGIPRRLI